VSANECLTTLKPVDVVFELEKTQRGDAYLRISKDMKKTLEEKARDKGVTISTLARILITEKLQTI
jgi:hypothetical protein